MLSICRVRWSPNAELVGPDLTSAPGPGPRREHDVLVLVADGKTNQEIADRLSLSARTVQKHLEHVYDKLGVRSRTAAAMKLASIGR